MEGDSVFSVGIIGLGAISPWYVEAIQRAPSFILAAVCDIDEGRTLPFRESDNVRLYGSAAALLEDGGVDAVVLDTPVATHVDLSRAALSAGKHVCCEKPLALTRSDASELFALAESLQLTLFTAFHRRYNHNLPSPGSLPVEELVAVEARYLEKIAEHTDGLGWYSTPAAAGGGCIVDNGPNAFDVVRHLFGEMTVEDVVVGRSPAGVDLNAVVRGRIGTGAEASIVLDWDFDGECKDLTAHMQDGTEIHVDLLAGFPAFKSSLQHEYVGVLDEFAQLVSSGQSDTSGYAATAWLEDVLTRGDKRGR